MKGKGESIKSMKVVPLSLRGLLGFDEKSSSFERNNLIAVKTYTNEGKETTH